MNETILQTELLDGQSVVDVRRAARLLHNNGIAAFPTDTVYGLGALVWNAASVARLYEAKERPLERAIPVLIANMQQLWLLGVELTDQLHALAQRFWPGPLTLVVPCGPQVPDVVTAGTGTVAVRIPAHRVALHLIELAGQPLAVTSANLSAQGSLLTAQDVLAQLAGRIDVVLDDGACPGGVPSTVLDLTQSPARILREGPITADLLAPFLSVVGPGPHGQGVA